MTHNICNTHFYPQDVAIDIEIKEKLIRTSNKDQVYKIAGTVLCQHLRRLWPIAIIQEVISPALTD